MKWGQGPLRGHLFECDLSLYWIGLSIRIVPGVGVTTRQVSYLGVGFCAFPFSLLEHLSSSP